MGLRYNPFTGNFDLTRSPGSYLDGEVAAYSDLPLDTAAAPLNSAWLVRGASGLWLLSRKPAGIFIRTATTGVRDADYTYAGTFPDVFSDANFVVYNDTDSTKNLKLDTSAITTGTTRTLTVPDKSGTIATTDAADLVSGTLADARLSSNVALKDAANTFTANQTLDGTNNVAPNQTAASGSSIMTRDLVEKRWSKWFTAGELADLNVTTSGKYATSASGSASGHPLNAFFVTIPNAGATAILLPVPWQTVGQIRAISYWSDRGNTNSGVTGDIAVWTRPIAWSVTTNSQTRSNPVGTQIQTVFTANYGGAGQARYYIVDQTVDFGTVSGIDGTDPLQIKTVEVQRRATDATDTSTDVIYLSGVHLIAV